MTVKGALIAALAAGYVASAVPAVAHAGDAEKDKTAKGDQAGCKGKQACKGKGKKSKKADKAEGEKAEGEKPAEPPK
jgi:hypothetical protein